MSNKQDVGQLLQKVRKEKGLTIEAVFKATHIHPGIIQSLEKGVPEDKLGKIYIRGFIRKYADFLGLDPKDILKQFEPLIKKDPEQEIFIKSPKENTVEIEKYLKPVMAVIAVILAIMLIFTGLVRVTRFISHRISGVSRKMEKRKEPTKKAEALPVRETLSGPLQKEETRKSNFKAQTGKFLLGVKTTDEVWVRVQKDGDVVFNGTLPKDSKEVWSADKEIDLRVGKLEAIEFTINDEYYGKIGNGVEDIVINDKGIKLGKKYLREKD